MPMSRNSCAVKCELYNCFVKIDHFGGIVSDYLDRFNFTAPTQNQIDLQMQNRVTHILRNLCMRRSRNVDRIALI